MPPGHLSDAVDCLRHAALARDGAHLADGKLLEAYISRHDEAALAALVRRHGPMVWGVCRRTLHNHHDAEDAFQATFLVLVRRAASIVPREMVGNWLFGVARQTALKARETTARRKERETQFAEMPDAPAPDQPVWCDLRPLLDEELAHLPDRYRAVIVLCDLEGQSRSQAARHLACPEGSVAGWLARARATLAKRLSRRGVALTAAALAALLALNTASASLPASLTASTIQAAATGTIPAHIAALTEGVLNAMSVNKLKWSALALVALAVGLAGTGLLVQQLPAQAPPPVTTVRAPAPAPKKPLAKEDEWGEPNNGVRLRARATKKQWRADEVPEFVVDLHNEKGGKLALMRLPYCEVVVDGVWYVPVMGAKLVAGAHVARNGEIHNRYAVIKLAENRWVRKTAASNPRDALRAAADSKNRLQLTPGKHTIRVASPIAGLAGDSSFPHSRPISNAVEFEIVAAKK
jgi:RNA polymerase sigma factor (sigma-70 family)